MKPEFDNIFSQGKAGFTRCWHNIRSGYLMMMLNYKMGRGGGQESGKKWFHNLNYVINYAILNFYQTNLYFFYLNFFGFIWYLCWVSFKLQAHYNKDYHERVDLLITASMNIYHTKTMYSNSNENMLFWRITDETIWNLSFQLTPLYLSNFFSNFLSEFWK